MKSKEKLKEFRLKSPQDLYDELKKQYKKLYELNFDKEFRKTKDIKSIRKTREDIARIWTVLDEKIRSADDKRSK